jgi:dephospho-CoA kinase
MPKIIGLTGGIGSGKSRVVSVFIALGVPCYITDQAAKKIMVNNAMVKEQILDLFGEKAFDQNGLNRTYLGELVFKDSRKLKALNAIVHPAVAQDFSEWVSQQNYPYIIKEVAILYETGGYKTVDQSLLITAPKEVRLQRAIQRDQSTKEEVLARMNNQWEDEQRLPLASHVIENLTWKDTEKEVKRLHKYFLSLA